MADVKISELPELAEAPADVDVFPLDDVSATQTKKITTANLRLAMLASTAPVNVDTAAGVVGVATAAARADHKHDVTTESAQAITGRVNAEGTSTSLARADHTHAISPPVGSISSSPYTLQDHEDGVLLVDTTAGPITINLPDPATVTGLPPYLIVDRENTAHINPITLARSGAEEIDDVAANKVLSIRGGRWLLSSPNGLEWITQESPSIDFDVPVAVGRVAAEGTSTSFARADHVHEAGLAISVENASFSLLASQDYIRINSAAGITITLPSPASIGNRRWRILLANNAAGDVTLDRFGAETIQGVAADYVLTGAWTTWELVSDGTNWWLF